MGERGDTASDIPRETIVERTLALRGLVGVMFKRKETDRWSYLEEQALCEVAKRDECLAEFGELSKFRPIRGKYFPQSIVGLLEKWTQTLDASRNGHSGNESRPLTVTELKIQRDELEKQVAEHPANPESTSRRGKPTDVMREDWESKKTKLKDVRRLIAEGGQVAA